MSMILAFQPTNAEKWQSAIALKVAKASIMKSIEKLLLVLSVMKQLINSLHFPRSLLLRLFLSLILAILVLGVGGSPAEATGAYDLPNLSAGSSTWVIDDADLLSRINEGKLSNKLKNLAQDTGNEVRFVTVRHLNYGETIETFTNELFESWFPTPEAQAKQTLLTLDSVTNNAYLRHGEDVTALLPEDIAESVVKDTIGIPLRTENKYNEALLNASDRLIAVLSGQPDPGAPEVQDEVNIEGTFATAEETDDRSATVWVIVLLIVATVIPMATYYFYQGFS